MDFIYIINKFPSLSKNDIDQDHVSEQILSISDILRSVFLLSNSLLHENNFFIICLDQFLEFPKELMIFFQGDKLRYLAPDERGILYLLLKIHKIITGEGNKKQERKEHAKFIQLQRAQSTPGIFMQKISIENIWQMHKFQAENYIIIGNFSNKYNRIQSVFELQETITSNSVLIIPTTDLNFDFPEEWNLYEFNSMDWKEKFYVSELISYIQANIAE
ncbi:MAG: hypothetical protein JW776_01745 [Candidatus Lokiarchaeota archaeon]|nr:hypothetical protein [Candidatus Lokiarchaeota archaeon]